MLDRQIRDRLEREVSLFNQRIVASRHFRPLTSADDFAWLHSVPRLFWRPAALLLSAFGQGRIHAAGVAIRDYQTFFAPIELGDIIYFSDRLSVSKVMREGWSEPEQTGVWSENECSAIVLQLTKSLSGFRMVFDLRPFADYGNSQAATVTVNGHEFDCWLFKTGERRLVAVDVHFPAPDGQNFDLDTPPASDFAPRAWRRGRQKETRRILAFFADRDPPDLDALSLQRRDEGMPRAVRRDRRQAESVSSQVAGAGRGGNSKNGTSRSACSNGSTRTIRRRRYLGVRSWIPRRFRRGRCKDPRYR